MLRSSMLNIFQKTYKDLKSFNIKIKKKLLLQGKVSLKMGVFKIFKEEKQIYINKETKKALKCMGDIGKHFKNKKQREKIK